VRLTLIYTVHFPPCNIYHAWILPRCSNRSVECVGTRFKFMRALHSKRELVKGRRILYAVSNGGIAQASRYVRDSFLANGLGGSFEAKERERNSGCGREILPTNGFAQSLAFPSSFSANSYSARNLQLRMLRTAMRILYLCSLATE